MVKRKIKHLPGLNDLKRVSLLFCLFMTLITLGTYIIYWVYTRNNKTYDREPKIGIFIIWLMLVAAKSYVWTISCTAILILQPRDLADSISIIMVGLIPGSLAMFFLASILRKRLEAYSQKDEELNLLLSGVFHIFYFQHMINTSHAYSGVYYETEEEEETELV